MTLSSSRTEFLKFATSGAIGFATELCITLALVIYVFIDPILAKLTSFPIAVLTTWLINRTYTFPRKSPDPIAKELLRYFQTTLAGAITNNTVYVGILFLLGESSILIAIASASGALSGMLVNYFGSKHYVFKRP